MIEAPGKRLLEACEALGDRLRRGVGLTTLRIELQRPSRPLIVSLRDPDRFARPDPRHDWMRPLPARLDVVVRHGDRVLAYLRLEDESRGRYPEDARAECERIAAHYAEELSDLLSAAL